MQNPPSINPSNIESFRREMQALCAKYNVLIKDEGIRREKPDGPVAFYEVQLSAKIDGNYRWMLLSN